jgi:hypothetical protein
MFRDDAMDSEMSLKATPKMILRLRTIRATVMREVCQAR